MNILSIKGNMSESISVVVYGHITILGPKGNIVLPPKVSYSILRRFNFVHSEVVAFIERNYVDIMRQNFYSFDHVPDHQLYLGKYDYLEFLDDMSCVEAFYDSLE